MNKTKNQWILINFSILKTSTITPKSKYAHAYVCLGKSFEIIFWQLNQKEKKTLKENNQKKFTVLLQTKFHLMHEIFVFIQSKTITFILNKLNYSAAFVHPPSFCTIINHTKYIFKKTISFFIARFSFVLMNAHTWWQWQFNWNWYILFAQ